LQQLSIRFVNLILKFDDKFNLKSMNKWCIAEKEYIYQLSLYILYIIYLSQNCAFALFYPTLSVKKSFKNVKIVKWGIFNIVYRCILGSCYRNKGVGGLPKVQDNEASLSVQIYWPGPRYWYKEVASARASLSVLCTNNEVCRGKFCTK